MKTNKEIMYKRIVNALTYFLEKYLWLIALTLGIYIFSFDFDAPNKPIFGDSDGYMRAIRFYHWRLNPTFLEQPIMESNYPFGEILHWTRPMDILWLLTSLPFQNITDNLKDAIILGGWFISPLLGILSAVILVWGLKQYFNPWLVLFGLLLWFSIDTTNIFFNPIRPDHHALMITLNTLAEALILCWFKKPKTKYLVLLGLTFALALFTAIEGFLIYLIFIIYLTGEYIFQQKSLHPARTVSLAFAAGLTVFWLSNPPYEGWFYPDNGRISILYVTLSWLIAASFSIVDKLKLTSPLSKLSLLSLAALCTGGILYFLFGGNIYYYQIDTELHIIWGIYIKEMQPLYTLPIVKLTHHAAFMTLTLILNIWLLRFKRHRRLLFFNLTLGCFIFSLSMFAVRFQCYETLFTIIPWLCLLEKLYKDAGGSSKEDFPVSVWIAAISIFLCQYLPEIPYSLEPKTSTITFTPSLCQNVKNIGGTLVTDTFLTPQYMWHCDVNSVATPYHRNRQGIIDNHNLLYTTDEQTVIRLMLKHQVTQILLFTDYPSQKIPEASLSDRLIKRENIPSFLEEVPSYLLNVRHYKLKI